MRPIVPCVAHTCARLKALANLARQFVEPFLWIAGWRRATEVARAALEAAAMDHRGDEEAFRADLTNIAATTLSSKLLTYEKNLFGA
jgi:T-complex protein 1 subunit beta